MDFFSMFGSDPMDMETSRRHYESFYHAPQPHQSSLTHEALAGAAGFAAMHAYEAHLRATGQPVSHGKMKELLAVIAAAEVDKLAETKGLNWIDREKAKRMATHQAHHLARHRYGQDGTGWEYTQQTGGPSHEYDFNGRGAPYGSQGCPSYGWYGNQYGGGGGYPQGGGGGGYQGGYDNYPPPQGYPGQYGGGGYAAPPPQGYYQPGYGQPPPPPGGGYYGNQGGGGGYGGGY